MEADANEALAAGGLVSALVARQARLRENRLQTRRDIERQRLATMNGSMEARLRVQQAAVDQATAAAGLQESRRAALQVGAGYAGVLQTPSFSHSRCWHRF